MTAPSAVTDAGRLAALRLTRLLDSEAEQRFDKITQLATELVGTPVSLLSLVEADRQFFKSQIGLPEPYASARETPLSHSFCQYVVVTGEPLVVEDARRDPLLKSNGAVIDLAVVSYLGVPVRAADGQVLGSLCAIGDKPRQWSDADIRVMSNLADVVEEHILLRASALEARELAANKELLAREYHHRVKNTLAVSAALVKLTARNVSSVQELVAEVTPRLLALSHAHDVLMTESDDTDLSDLVKRLLLPYCPPGASADVDGPKVQLVRQHVTPLCLIIHELATNSVKYGAFHNREAVSVRWQRLSDNILQLQWREHLTGQANAHSGFGTKLMEIAATQLRGELKSAWGATQLETSVTFPLQP